MEKTYHFKVLGCRMNHAERREMESVLQAKGMKPSTDSPDLEIVHTCSVTGQAAAKSRNAIRRAAKNGKHVIVTGCFTGTDPKVAMELGNTIVTQAGETPMLERFEDEINHWLETPSEQNEKPKTTSLPLATLPSSPAEHTRAELRIQDGCDAHCTFCIIPKIRTTLRSKTIEDIVTEATRLVELGHKEIIFTGIFIGAYGHETALRRKQKSPEQEHLADLLDAVAQINGLKRLRISSMEPGDVTPVLLDAMVANQTVVVPHLHLPLQSGSDAVLQKMNRQYGVSQYLEMIAMVNERLTYDNLPPAITTDIICGFPTETENDFAQSVSVAKQVGYLHMHTFPYSVRTGTAAARWEQLHPTVVNDRVQQLLALDDVLSLLYREHLVSRQVEVMLEQYDTETKYFKGRCEHYAEITLKSTGTPGDIVSANVIGLDGPKTMAKTALQVL
ncbi:MAG TPA: MiaB/RimO family radical SAM methylthiotransferase [Phycisphaerales bacterium]|nr:MiaB/RimO family radical SAM methylthiotransferase [Phycisphaerales bacterium]HIN84141.1 MiaB/RimO family radical SAM methylthiotransferase [Phycisphaerales bacterium]HIO52056.1 MiaB/RimO family radical SAM methylthiotransferase [Phycisphaerales bacterium]